MTAEVREIERKYDIKPGAGLPHLEGLPQVASESSVAEEVLDAVYYDTGDLRLARAGITLRRRRGGADPGWHLKLPEGAGSRREIQLPLGRADRGVPGDLAALVRVHTRGEELRPTARITTARRRRVLLDDAGASLAEVVADDVSAQTMGEATALSQWQEVEVELTGGDPGLLRAADKKLRRRGLRPARHGSKLEQALAGRWPGTAARPELSARSPAADVVLAYFRAHLDALKSVDPQVRRDEPDSVHQMRVTVRRLRATLRNFRDILPGRDATWLASELRWLGGVLAASRDDEVLTERLQDRQQDTPPELVIGPVNARIRRQFAPLEADARAAVLEALDSGRYLALIDGLDKLAADPPATAAASQPAGDVLPRIAARAHRRARRRMRRALQAPPGHGRDAALHSARKAVRRARYAAEAAGPGAGKKASRFAKKMKRVQSVLGEHHDTVVARDTLRDLGVRAHLAGENAFTYGLFHGREAGEALTLENLAKQVWARASRPKQVTWMR